MALVRWFWALDRRRPFDVWEWALGIGLVWRAVIWAAPVPHAVAIGVGAPVGVAAGASFLSWLVLYERDAVRGWRSRRAERAR